MKVKEIIKVLNETMDDIYRFKSPVNCQDIADWLIWTDGVCYPGFKAPLYIIMNMLAIDMIMEGKY